MAADILAFDAHKVPVGRDQIQHLEMARDIAQRFNHIYGQDFFVLPEVQIEEQVATLPGLDGRKMSKSNDNTIPVVAGGAKALREAVMRIVTDSRLPGEPKDPESSSLYTLYRAFASDADAAAFRGALESGLAWGEAKQALFDLLEGQIAPMRERYDALIAQPAHIEAILQEGARKARAIATPKMARLRDAVGLGSHVVASGAAEAAKPRGDKPPRLASFRDEDGRFRFRLFAGDGEELLLSRAFDDPKAAGVAQKQLRQGDGTVTLRATPAGGVLELDGSEVGSTPAFADEATRDQALGRLREALDQLAGAA
jgi:tryptophanyl-tRNA synthetase